jgi:hypothetical protein
MELRNSQRLNAELPRSTPLGFVASDDVTARSVASLDSFGGSLPFRFANAHRQYCGDCGPSEKSPNKFNPVFDGHILVWVSGAFFDQ